MLKNYKYRIYPSRSQKTLLKENLEECRWLYNHLLYERKKAWEDEKRSVGYFNQCKTITNLKEDRENLKKINTQVLQNVATRVDLAFKAFFRRCKSGDKPGYPRFKGKGRYDSITFPQYPSGCKIRDGKLIVSKIGKIKIKQHRELEGKPKTATIFRSPTGKWYVTFSCEIFLGKLHIKENVVGIDVGINTFATLSDKKAIENPRFFREEEKDLVNVQRKLSKGKKGTKDRYKKRKVVARVHERIKFKRENFSHQESRKIVNEYGKIFVEDLNVNKMIKNKDLSKSISDASWSTFFSMLSYKAAEAGRTFMAVNPAYTSQTCSSCGTRQKMPLSNRTYVCSECGIVLDRDHNASLNILRLGLQSVGNQSLKTA